jgi:lipopolysaccharide/colanic/teichoic acid biosynthesis glycosyltransferase
MAKRAFDIFFALTGLLILGVFIFCFVIGAGISTGQSGIFIQTRIGQHGKRFTIFKLRSMKDVAGGKIITRLGRFMRKYKIDELPQLYNILIGNMSFVGPRPDLPGYYDKLQGEDRKLLQLKPGLTGPASLKYADEEDILAKVSDPLTYNDTVIFPDKVRINLRYLKNRSLGYDVKIIWYTLTGKKKAGEYF